MVFSVATTFRRTTFETFALTYSEKHVALTLHAVAHDQNHPLSLARSRKESQKPKTGLWWHVAVNTNASSAKVVRTWLTRRLRNAFFDELRLRGITHDGKLLNFTSGFTHKGELGTRMQNGEELSLTGSIRLQCKPPLVTAKYDEVRRETGRVVDILLRGVEENPVGKERQFREQTYKQTFPRPRGQKQMERFG